ncbi:unnamed protein product [Schistosoma margrebowiei]|uniref:Uncharacterized protein n=1 Tax=Schistosoma margrebowiei TaxID=48269 RepID=A0A183M767_9TREM|nr:unnamed protein product [Schistosoma margrebowiei]
MSGVAVNLNNVSIFHSDNGKSCVDIMDENVNLPLKDNYRKLLMDRKMCQNEVREWIIGTGTKLLDSQTSKPYNFEEACQIRKSHEQFEFKCMLWNILEDLQKREKEVDTYDGTSIKNAISDLEHGVEKCEVRLNGLAHELERLRIILKPSDPDYLGQLEDGFRDACRAATEATQSLKIRKLVLKKHSKVC